MGGEGIGGGPSPHFGKGIGKKKIPNIIFYLFTESGGEGIGGPGDSVLVRVGEDRFEGRAEALLRHRVPRTHQGTQGHGHLNECKYNKNYYYIF